MSQIVLESVRKLASEHLGVPLDKIMPGSSFIDDLGADSLDTIELAQVFEEEFGIEIPDDLFEEVETVQDAATWISAAQAKKA